MRAKIIIVSVVIPRPIHSLIFFDGDPEHSTKYPKQAGCF